MLSGSLPPRCPADYYAQLLRAAAGQKCRCVLDADGAPLREGLKAGPWMLKPNRAELEALTGRKLASVQDVRDAARELVAGGAGVVAVSLGAEGAVAVDAREAFFAPAPAHRGALHRGRGRLHGRRPHLRLLPRGKGLEEAFRMAWPARPPCA